MPSKLDAVYRALLLGKFFTKVRQFIAIKSIPILNFSLIYLWTKSPDSQPIKNESTGMGWTEEFTKVN